jgi:two-component system phosphate regulon sensor histidine kinase PhoR
VKRTPNPDQDHGTAASSDRRGPQINRSVILSQLLFGSAVLSVLTLIQWFAPGRLTDHVMFIGVVLAFVATGAALLVPWNRFDKRWIMVLPVTDMVAILLLRIETPEMGLGVLWFLPVIWLSTYFGLTGTITAVALATLGSWVTVAIEPSAITLSSFTLLVLLPLVLSIVAASTHISSRRDHAQRTLMRKQASLLNEAFVSARHHEQLLTEVLNTVTFGVVRFDRDGVITFANSAHTRMHDRDSALPDRPRHEVVYQADRTTPFREEERPFFRSQRGEAFDDVLIWVGNPGEDRHAYFMTSRRLVDSRDGSFDGTILVSGEVTTELNAISARDDLIASVSHELRTPLTSILGYLELVLDDDLPDHARPSLEIVERNSNRLLDLVTEILSASRQASKPLEITPVPVDLGTTVLQSAESLLPRARERDVVVDTSGVRNVLTVADPFRMRQVIDNVLSNAIKYNVDHGRVDLALRQQGEELVLTVRDTGIGISGEELPKLFEHFFRSAAVRNSAVHGSGLGMGIAREIVRKHGGDLTVESTLGSGTTVTVTVPTRAAT